MKLVDKFIGIHFTHFPYFLVYFSTTKKIEDKNSSSNARFYREINVLFSCTTPQHIPLFLTDFNKLLHQDSEFFKDRLVIYPSL